MLQKETEQADSKLNNKKKFVQLPVRKVGYPSTKERAKRVRAFPKALR
jgi:hypothetical protein